MIDSLFPHTEIVPEAISRATAQRIELAGFERYLLLDRGSYEIAPFRDDDLVLALCELAVPRLGVERLTAMQAVVVRLRAGDYVLARHDLTYARLTDPSLCGPNPFESRWFELVLDLSPEPVDAEIHYRRRGQTFFRVPCTPRSLAIIERTPTVTCNHVYLSKRAPDAVVTRLIFLVR